MEWLADPSQWFAFAVLLLLEIVLGIDNIIFISVLTNKLPIEKREKVRRLGLTLAMVMRILLVMGISWVIGLTEPVFTAFEKAISWKDLILVVGGLFLLAKSTMEIHHSVEDGGHEEKEVKLSANMTGIIIQILMLDLVFSVDSVITAVGMVKFVSMMVAVIIISVAVMMFTSKYIADFIEKHPTFKMLALSFLMLIGMSLVGEGLHFHIPKGYLYFAISFSLIVEVLNTKVRKKHQKSMLLRAPAVSKD
ncbi:TerC family protein [Seleniivibrio sp.]|uniref:TerC family protein n=1 Tax=Seleniivibrio sp. TaxID=2898801 RepID=UPI0025E645EB|nr:TerC family protein [Seleniivibrio sp.]MCD8552728.1 TerC family protein [Seleniivibrio sp.]